MQIPEELGGIMKEKSTTTQMMMVETVSLWRFKPSISLYFQQIVYSMPLYSGEQIAQQQ
jgi:hypothetical protein